MKSQCSLVVWIMLLVCGSAIAAKPAIKNDTTRGDKMIAAYFESETAKLRDACLANIKTKEDWTSRREGYRKQLLEMLGLDPLPKKTDLKAKITGTIEKDDFIVENLHFQSRPGLYVTANLYRPKKQTKPLPAILYVCGHGGVKKNGISYGNKVHYHHHGAWFARNGYVCLIIDSLQLGEIEAIHHGTYRYDMWWWNSRGYTPAGVEAWNCVRALDYLETRKEVDPKRFGVTGRSGGGAYSWWIAAIDERIKVAVPVAGITDLQNHVVDGTVEGHCDCMFMVNMYRWDYPQVAAMIAPRALLISNSDKDGIFPLDGVIRTHLLVRKIYRLYGAADKLGLQITEGPHKDTQELRVHAFHWFNRFLKNDRELIEKTAVSYFKPEELRVFKELPKDQINTKIHETFTAKAPAPVVPKSKAEWKKKTDGWLKALREKTFRGWPETPCDLNIKKVFSVTKEGMTFSAYDFDSQKNIRLRLYVTHKAGVKPVKATTFRLAVATENTWALFIDVMKPTFEKELQGEQGGAAFPIYGTGIPRPDDVVEVFIAPRGIGPTAWDQSKKKQTQHRRRFMLLGQTLDGMRVWDVRRAIGATSKLFGSNKEIILDSNDQMGPIALYASVFEKTVKHVRMMEPPSSLREGPTLLGALRILDTPECVALALSQGKSITITTFDKKQSAEKVWDYPRRVFKQLEGKDPPPSVYSVMSSTK